MKIIVIIFSVYMLGLTVMPCNDKVTAGNDPPIQLVIENYQNSHDEIDFCSPFCSFGCCQSLYQPVVNGFTFSKLEGFDIQIPIILDNHTNPAISFWRPPKI